METPSEAELRTMYDHVDADHSGEVDLVEVQEQVHHMWPYLDSTAFHRAFQAADTDHSGQIDFGEFKSLIEFIIWLNDKRHSVQELQDAFGTHVVSIDRQYLCFILRAQMTD